MLVRFISTLQKLVKIFLADGDNDWLKGKTRTLADYRGKVVLVNFWASWCTPCVLEMPELTQLKQHMTGRPFEIIAINVGERENRVKHFAKRINFNLPVLLDTTSKVFNEWNIEIMPTSFLIGANGFVRYRVLGNPGWDDKNTIAVIEQLIAEQPTKQEYLKTTTPNEANE